LYGVLVAAREAGFLGPGPIERHLRHARGFVDLGRMEADTESPRILDLGSGGGLPGLVVAGSWPEATVVLLEANERRAGLLDLDLPPDFAVPDPSVAASDDEPLEDEAPSEFHTDYLGPEAPEA
jgi:hypothetical protein